MNLPALAEYSRQYLERNMDNRIAFQSDFRMKQALMFARSEMANFMMAILLKMEIAENERINSS